MRRRSLLPLPLLAAGIVAGCGANNADTAHITPPPSQSQTLTYTATSTSSSSTSSVTVTTPKTGPLSTEPTVTPPKTAAPTTLVKKDLITGTGAVAANGDAVTVNYVGVLYKTGKTFDSSWQRSQTFPFVIGATGAGAVIPGWDQGVVGMHVGGRRELIIPPSLGYGSTAQSAIPANSTLIFVIDLLAVTPPAGSAGSTAATGSTGATG